jgi:predicted PurR-regulated permease PerM
MTNDALNKNLKILAIITLIIFIAYTLIQIGSYFMNLVTIFGISIILTYILLVPVNSLEGLIDKVIFKIIKAKTPEKNVQIGQKVIRLPDIIMVLIERGLELFKKYLPFLHKRVLSIFIVYIVFLFIVVFIAFQVVPPAIYQVSEFARNIPSYAESSLNYLNEKFPQVEIPGLNKVMEQNIYQNRPANDTIPVVIHETSPTGEVKQLVKSPKGNIGELVASHKKISQEELKTIVTQTATKFQDDISTFIQQNAQTAISNLINVAAGTLAGIGYTVTIIVLSFYFLLDGKRLIESINKLIPDHLQDKTIELETSIHNSLLGFLKGQVFLGIVTGGFMLIVYMIAGVKYSIFLSLFLAIAEIIPVIGSSLGFIPAIIVMLFTDSLSKIALVWFIFFLFQTVKDNVVAPKIVGEIIGLHPVTVIFALWIGFQLAGFFGILFAIPIASVINVIINFIICEKSKKEEKPADN